MSDKKIFIVNGSPRKNWNTAKMCKSFADGAGSKGAATQIINLYDIDFKGCISCFACKLKGGAYFGRCACRDGLTAMLEEIYHADGLVLASPIYLGDVTSSMRAFVERLIFPLLQYDERHSSIAPKRFKTAVIYTMNVSEDYFFNEYLGRKESDTLRCFESFIKRIFTEPQRLYAFDTYQFTDYDKYVVECFDKNKKAKQREEQFPKDLQAAYDAGALMAASLCNDA